MPPQIRSVLQSIVSVDAQVDPSSSSSASGHVNHPSSSSSSRDQSARRFLMVAPVHFARNEETALDNTFMQQTGSSSTNTIRDNALKEFDAFVNALHSRDIDVRVHRPAVDEPNPSPDACYPNNWFTTHRSYTIHGEGKDSPLSLQRKSMMILYPMRHASRRAERDPALIRSLLKSGDYHHVFDLSTFEGEQKYFEGTGVALLDRINRVTYMCRSERGHEEVGRIMTEAIWPPCTLPRPSATASPTPYSSCPNPHACGAGRTIVFEAFDTNGKPIYHTNVLLAIGTGWAVICSECISEKSSAPTLSTRAEVLSSLRSSGRDVLEISRQQMSHFCANILEVCNTAGEKFLVMSSRAYEAFNQQQKETLKKHVKDILHAKLDTIEEIGGGGARCMIAELY